MKKILLPTDFSNNSINAINYAVELFKDEVCVFYLINIQKASSFISDNLMMMNTKASIYKTIISAAKKSINNLASTIETNYQNKNHTFETVLDYDNFIDSIDQAIEKHEIDLIVMGTKGASGVKRVLFGSNTVKVIKRCNKPVLAIPNGYNYSPLQTLALTTNNIEAFKSNELSALKDLLAIRKPKLKVIHIENEYYEEATKLKNIMFINEYFNNVTCDHIDVKSNHVYKSVYNYIGENKIDLLAMTAKKHSFIERLFSTFPEEKFAFKIDIPLLVMKA